MHCSEFRDQHCAFVDDTLAGVELVRMQRHIAECTVCAELDARMRRSLMVARNLPHIEPSAEFAQRLEARLRSCREHLDEHPDGTACVNFKTVAAMGAVASFLMLGYMAESLHRTNTPRDIVLSPVVAMAEPPQTEPMLAPAIIASVSTGLPVWPAALFADQVPLHFANYSMTH